MKPELMSVDDYCRLCSEFEGNYESVDPEINLPCEEWFCVDGDDMALACREMRCIAGWSQKRLARAVGLSNWQVRDRESGRITVDSDYCKSIYNAIEKGAGDRTRRAIKGLRAYCVMANFADTLRDSVADTKENMSREIAESQRLLKMVLPFLTVGEYACVLRIVAGMAGRNVSQNETCHIDGIGDYDSEIARKLLASYPKRLSASQFEDRMVGSFMHPERKS